MCLEEYVKYHTSEVAIYRRLSATAAQKRWQKEFNTLEKEQRMSVDEDGNEAGLANRQQSLCNLLFFCFAVLHAGKPVSVSFRNFQSFNSISICDSRRVEASQCNRFILLAKVWVLWVPLEDEKVTTDYSDRAVAHESSLQEKTPTERKIQEYKEKRDQLWDWEDEHPAISGTSTSTGKRAAPAVGEGAVATVGNRKNTAKQMKRTISIMPAHCNVTLEAAKYKAATIKD